MNSLKIASNPYSFVKTRTKQSKHKRNFFGVYDPDHKGRNLWAENDGCTQTLFFLPEQVS